MAREIPSKKIRTAIRKATCAVEMVPVTCGSSTATRVCRSWTPSWTICPAPTDVPANVGTHPKTDEEEDAVPATTSPLPRWPSSIMTDPCVGRLTFFRFTR